jgi:hypothetical protein
MPYRHYVLTLSGSAQQLSTVFSAAEKETNPKGPSISALSLQPSSSNANAIWIGSSAVAANAAAVRLSSALAGEPPAPWYKENSGGVVSLSDYYVLGTAGEKLLIGIDVE